MNEKIIIKSEKLCKSFSNGGIQQHVLKNLDMQIYEGDFTVIMGPSGAGKSICFKRDGSSNAWNN